MPKHRLLFYKNRSTPQVVNEGENPRPKKGYGKLSSSRKANDKEEKEIAKGRWLRVREDGKAPNAPGAKKSRYRPKLAKNKKQPESAFGWLRSVLLEKPSQRLRFTERDRRRYRLVFRRMQRTFKGR